MFLLNLFKWLGQSPVGVFMQQSTYAFAIVEMVHLLSLTALGGAILIVNLSVLGIGLKNRPAGRLSAELAPYLAGSLVVAATSGVLLLAEEPMKCYYNPAFRAKMVLLILAVFFYFFVQVRLFRSAGTAKYIFLSRSAGVVSLALWLAVGLAGRAIGFI
jgi:hypothetical protein